MLQTTHLRFHLDELSEKMWTVFSIDPTFSLKLQQNAHLKLEKQLFRDAELASTKKVTPQIRNDRIFWLDAKSIEINETEQQLLAALDELRLTLKNDFRIFLDSVECHYAFYEKGHFYKKHQDSTVLNNKRIFSFVLYLNPNWQQDEGGDLVGYKGEQILFSLKPELGQMILFRSDLEHEVLPTFRDRFSIAGWFRQ